MTTNRLTLTGMLSMIASTPDHEPVADPGYLFGGQGARNEAPAPKGVGVRRGVPQHAEGFGEGLCPSTENFWIFKSRNGVFWWILMY